MSKQPSQLPSRTPRTPRDPANDALQNTLGSLESANIQLNNLIHNICEKQWEQEVITKKLPDHCVDDALSYAVEPKNNGAIH